LIFSSTLFHTNFTLRTLSELDTFSKVDFNHKICLELDIFFRCHHNKLSEEFITFFNQPDILEVNLEIIFFNHHTALNGIIV